MADLLVSFCNVRRVREGLEDPAFLARVSTEDGEVVPVADELLTLRRVGGVTGVCHYDGGYACMIQSTPNSTLCLLDSDFSVREKRYLGGVTRAHSLTSRGTELFVVSTGSDSVVRWTPDATPEVIWQLTGDKSYTAHINSVTFHRGRLCVSGFGAIARDSPTHQQGFVVDIENGEQLLTGITQPHSLISVGDEFMLAESGAGSLFCSDGTRLQVGGGYIRGLARNDEALYVGRSAPRHRKRAKRGGVAGSQGPSDSCAMLTLDPGAANQGKVEITRTVELGDHAREVYDVLII